MTKQRICIICARGGSKGLPGKNIKPLAGKPLIAHSIEHAQKSKLFDAIVVSSDDDAIIQAASNAGASTVKRATNLATDEIGVMPAIIDAIAQTEKLQQITFDTVVLLQATSPIRKAGDIINMVTLQEESQAPSVLSVCIPKHSPYYTILEQNEDGTVGLSKTLPHNIERRQDAPKCYALNGSIYVWERDLLLQDQQSLYPNSKLYKMNDASSVDIDSLLDFQFAEFLLSQSN